MIPFGADSRCRSKPQIRKRLDKRGETDPPARQAAAEVYERQLVLASEHEIEDCGAGRGQIATGDHPPREDAEGAKGAESDFNAESAEVAKVCWSC